MIASCQNVWELRTHPSACFGTWPFGQNPSLVCRDHVPKPCSISTAWETASCIPFWTEIRDHWRQLSVHALLSQQDICLQGCRQTFLASKRPEEGLISGQESGELVLCWHSYLPCPHHMLLLCSPGSAPGLWLCPVATHAGREMLGSCKGI